MAPKSKATAAVPSPSFDRRRFQSLDKEEFFNDMLQPLEFVRERRIVYQEGDYDEFRIQKALEFRNWSNLCQPSHEAFVVAVKDFYANSRWDDVRHPPLDLSYVSWY